MYSLHSYTKSDTMFLFTDLHCLLPLRSFCHIKFIHLTDFWWVPVMCPVPFWVLELEQEQVKGFYFLRTLILRICLAPGYVVKIVFAQIYALLLIVFFSFSTIFKNDKDKWKCGHSHLSVPLSSTQTESGNCSDLKVLPTLPMGGSQWRTPSS